MTDVRTTRCPHCRTAFRATAAQLEARAGRVRCGHCRQVFDAAHHLLPIEEPAAEPAGTPAAPTFGGAASTESAPSDDVSSVSTFADGVPAVSTFAEGVEAVSTFGPAASPYADAFAAVAPVSADTVADVSTAPDVARESPMTGDGAVDAPSAPEATPVDAVSTDATAVVPVTQDSESASTSPTAAAAPAPPPVSSERVVAATVGRPHFSWEHADDGGRRWLWVALIPLLALLLATQAAYQMRHVLAARMPVLRPALIAGCQWIGCRIEPPRARDRLSIEASELQADAAHRGLLVLTATLRNRADMAVAYPHLELTLTDLQQQAVARRAFAPGEYAGGTVQVEAGIPANGEVALRLFIDASATQQQGYRLYLFYP